LKTAIESSWLNLIFCSTTHHQAAVFQHVHDIRTQGMGHAVSNKNHGAVLGDTLNGGEDFRFCGGVEG
jgi:hypothetical protein